jgi:hypothetical protein
MIPQVNIMKIEYDFLKLLFQCNKTIIKIPLNEIKLKHVFRTDTLIKREKVDDLTR